MYKGRRSCAPSAYMRVGLFCGEAERSQVRVQLRCCFACGGEETHLPPLQMRRRRQRGTAEGKVGSHAHGTRRQELAQRAQRREQRRRRQDGGQGREAEHQRALGALKSQRRAV